MSQEHYTQYYFVHVNCRYHRKT